MMHGRNNGKKLMAVRIVAHAFEIVSGSSPPLPQYPAPPSTNRTDTRREHAKQSHTR